MLLDPGGRLVFKRLLGEAGRAFPIGRLRAVFVSHQDPDVVAALPSWVLVAGDVRVYAPAAWTRFLPHMFSERPEWDFVVEVPDEGSEIPLGKVTLRAIPAHFLHSAANFSLYDPESKILFSGDVGASIIPPEEDSDFAGDFESHLRYMEGFHRRYMASSRACRRWVSLVRELDVEVIAPQHGAIIRGRDNVQRFLDWLEGLECGVDLL